MHSYLSHMQKGFQKEAEDQYIPKRGVLPIPLK